MSITNKNQRMRHKIGCFFNFVICLADQVVIVMWIAVSTLTTRAGVKPRLPDGNPAHNPPDYHDSKISIK